MATTDANTYIVSTLIYQATSDVINGFTNIPQGALSNSAGLSKVLADNIVSTLNSSGTPQQESQMSKLSVADQGKVLTTVLGVSVAEFALINNITSTAQDTFIKDVISRVMTGLQDSPTAPIPVSHEAAVTVAKAHLQCKVVGNNSRKYVVIAIVVAVLAVAAAVGVYMYYNHKKVNSNGKGQ